MKLYDVSKVLVEADVHLDHLETEDPHTRLHIINSSQSTNNTNITTDTANTLGKEFAAE